MPRQLDQATDALVLERENREEEAEEVAGKQKRVRKRTVEL